MAETVRPSLHLDDPAPRSLFITQDFPPRLGGSQSYHWGVIQTLRPEDVVIVAPAHPDAAAFDASHPYTVVRSESAVLLPTPRLFRLARWLIDAHDLRLVQLGHPLPNGLLGPELTRVLGLPYLVFLAGAEVTLPAALPASGQAIRRVLRRASLLASVSAFTAGQAVRLVKGRVPVAVLRPAIDTGAFLPAMGDERLIARSQLGVTGDLVVALGRLVPRKGQDRLVDALGLLARDRPDLQLALVGSGRKAVALQRRAHRRGVADRVHLLGALPHDELARWLQAADVLASPCRSRWGGLEAEGFGIVFAEGSLAGLPVMAGFSGGAPEAVVMGETGVVVDGRSPAEVAAGLDRLLRLSEAERRRMGLRGRSVALRRHSPEAVGARYRELLWGMVA